MIARFINKIVSWFEKQAFGVCTSIGKKMGLDTITIRLYFIYVSFFTFGSPVILYFILAFLKENKKYFLSPFKVLGDRSTDL
jgi:phage shock protein C